MDLMIHYQDEPGLHNHMEAHERMRAIQLPLWSEMNHVLGGIGMNDPVNGTTGSGAANSNVSANHPLLMGRQANGTSMEPAGPRGTSRSLTRQLHRGTGASEATCTWAIEVKRAPQHLPPFCKTSSEEAITEIKAKTGFPKVCVEEAPSLSTLGMPSSIASSRT